MCVFCQFVYHFYVCLVHYLYLENQVLNENLFLLTFWVEYDLLACTYITSSYPQVSFLIKFSWMTIQPLQPTCVDRIATLLTNTLLSFKTGTESIHIRTGIRVSMMFYQFGLEFTFSIIFINFFITIVYFHQFVAFYFSILKKKYRYVISSIV